MADESGLFVGQIGAVIRLDTEDDPSILALASVSEIHYRRPNGVVGKWTASIEGTKLVYTTSASGDLPVSGEYIVQAYLEGPGWALHGNKAVMLIEDPV